jgi:DNA repair exonuclease SbcCD ATPase subunit
MSQRSSNAALLSLSKYEAPLNCLVQVTGSVISTPQALMGCSFAQLHNNITQELLCKYSFIMVAYTGMCIVQVKSDLEHARAGLQQWQQDAQREAAKGASASADTKRLIAELEQRDQQIASLKVAVESEAMSAQHLSGKLDARCEEVSSLQSQLQTAQDMARRLQDQLSHADAEIRHLRAAAASATQSQTCAEQDAESLRAHSQSLASRLEDSESRLTSLQEVLDKRQQEVGFFKKRDFLWMRLLPFCLKSHCP